MSLSFLFCLPASRIFMEMWAYQSSIFGGGGGDDRKPVKVGPGPQYSRHGTPSKYKSGTQYAFKDHFKRVKDD